MLFCTGLTACVLRVMIPVIFPDAVMPDNIWVLPWARRIQMALMRLKH